MCFFGTILGRLAKGSKNHPKRKNFKKIYITLTLLFICSLIYAGPVSGTKCVLEYKAKYKLNQIGKECKKVDIHEKIDAPQNEAVKQLHLTSPKFYSGTAYLKSGDKEEIIVIYDQISDTSKSGYRHHIKDIAYQFHIIPAE